MNTKHLQSHHNGGHLRLSLLLAAALLVVLAVALTGCGGSSGGGGGGGAAVGGGATEPVSFAVSDPADAEVLSNTATLEISGTCSAGSTVTLDGDDSQSVACAGGAFAFTAAPAGDGTFHYVVGAQGSAETVERTWTRDTVSPAEPALASPATSPAVSSDDTLSVTGACESGATVYLSGDESGQAACADGAYSFAVTRTSDGVYDFSLAQQDAAGNLSDATLLTWERDGSVPATPTITAPAENPYYSNAGGLTLAGGCTSSTPHTVDLDGAQVALTACSSDSYSFAVSDPAADGTYTYYVGQTNDATGVASADATFTWVLDTAAPAAPALTSPAVDPYTAPGPLTLEGACETGATVALSGDATDSATCAEGGYSFVVDAASDGTYSYSLTQTDRAGNASPAVSQTWVRDSTGVPAPSITTPQVSPYRSNKDTLRLAGACITGFTVALGGDDSQSVTCAESAFAFVIDKTGVDGSYSFSVTQDSGSQVSDPATQTWIKDTVAPDLTVSSVPDDPNPWSESRFEFTSTDGEAGFECDLDGAGFAGCASPKVYGGLTGTHSVAIRARDLAGNLSAPFAYTWTQEDYATVVLYHLDDAAPLADDSLYAGAFANPLTTDATTASAPGMFAQGRRFAAAEGDVMAASDNAKHQGFRSRMTVEAWVRFAALPANQERMVVVSKTDAGDAGWAFGLKGQGASHDVLFFAGSEDGVSMKEAKTSPLPDMQTGVFYHLAVTWNKGAVTFYLDGVQQGTRSIGTAGSTVLYDSTAPLRLGSLDGSAEFLDGTVDELRLSQVVRYSSGFTPPAAAFVAD